MSSTPKEPAGSEPVELSAGIKAEIGKIVARYPQRAAALLPVLHLVQEEYGHLAPPIQVAVAHALDVPPTQVREVVTFYEMFHETPEGQFHLEVCTNIACHLAGADCLVSHLERKLGIKVGHHTEDGKFSLMEAECLASCGSAPVMRVGMDYYEHVTEAAADALVGRFHELAPKLDGKHYAGAEPEAHVGPVPGFSPPAAPLASVAPVASVAPEVSAAPPPSPAPAAPPPPAAEAPAADGEPKKLPSFPAPPKT